MPQYTHPDCLPYFDGSDSPCLNAGELCEPSTVWCDFAERVEDKLDQLDVVVDVVSNPPIAWIETLLGMTVFVDTLNDEPIIFETVRADSANMVNLDANPSGVLIPRTGLYTVFLYCRATTVLGGANFIDLVMSTTAVPGQTSGKAVTPSIGLACDQAVQLDDVQIAPNYSLTTFYEAGQQVNAFLNANGSPGDHIVASKISMGVAWMGDLP